MQFEQPQKKLNGKFISRVRNVKACIFDTRIVHIEQTSSKDCCVLKLWIPPNSDNYKEIAEIDSKLLEVIISNNKIWFNNTLSEEHIKKYFRPSIDPQTNTISVICNTDSVNDSAHAHANTNEGLNGIVFELESEKLTFDIELYGVVWSQRKCGARWVLRKYTKDINEDILPDKTEIVDEWKHDVSEFIEKLQDSKQEYISYCDNYILKLNQSLENIMNDENIDDAKYQKLNRLLRTAKIFSWIV